METPNYVKGSPRFLEYGAAMGTEGRFLEPASSQILLHDLGQRIDAPVGDVSQPIENMWSRQPA